MRFGWRHHHTPPASRATFPSSARWISSTSLRHCNFSISNVLCALVALLAIYARPGEAVFLPNWTNCNNVGSQALQWTPFGVWADFNLTGNYNLNLTFFGNVSGQRTTDQLPPPDSPQWGKGNHSAANGEIIDEYPKSSRLTTLWATINGLGYTPYSSGGLQFCNYTTNNTHCPIAPVFPEVNPK